MISLVRAACRFCDYQAMVGIGCDEGATVPVHWAPANCAACGVGSVNVDSYGEDSNPECHECGELLAVPKHSRPLNGLLPFVDLGETVVNVQAGSGKTGVHGTDPNPLIDKDLLIGVLAEHLRPYPE